MWTLVSSPVEVPCWHFLSLFCSVHHCIFSTKLYLFWKFYHSPGNSLHFSNILTPFTNYTPNLENQWENLTTWWQPTHLSRRHRYLDSEPNIIISSCKPLFSQLLEYQVLSLPLSLRSSNYCNSSLSSCGSWILTSCRYSCCWLSNTAATRSCRFFFFGWGDFDWRSRKFYNVTNVASLGPWKNDSFVLLTL